MLLLQGGAVFPWKFIIISVNRDLKIPLRLSSILGFKVYFVLTEKLRNF